MKGKYRGCDIEVERGGAEFLTFAVFDDGYEVNLWSEQSPSILKKRIKYCKNPMEKKKLQQELNALYRYKKKRRTT